MCEPTTIAMASLAITAIGAGTQAYGQKQAGEAAAELGEYNQQVAANNAKYSEAMAQDALQRGDLTASRQRERTAQEIAQQTVAAAGNGVDVNTGSIVDLTSDTARYGELDRLTILNNAQREAFGNRVRGANFESEGNVAYQEGQYAKSAGTTAAFGTALSGAGNVATKWYNFDQAGAFGSKTKTKTKPHRVVG
jgi:hypothetical protein